VIESPNAMIAVAWRGRRTSIDFSQNIAVVLPVNGFAVFRLRLIARSIVAGDIRK